MVHIEQVFASLYCKSLVMVAVVIIVESARPCKNVLTAETVSVF